MAKDGEMMVKKIRGSGILDSWLYLMRLLIADLFGFK
jgi:hypothetical protein